MISLAITETVPLLETLSVMLCSRAVYAAKKQADPAVIDKLITTIAKFEKLKRRPQRQPRSTTTRHRVELSVVPANSSPQTPPKVIELTATPLPPHENQPA